MNLLSIINTAALRIGLPTTNVVASSTDGQVLQLLALANEELRKLATGESVGLSYDWQALVMEASHTALGQEDQGAIDTIAPGLKFIINGTIFNRTLRRPVPGPLAPVSWQHLKAANVVGPYPQWRIRGGRLLLLPAPVAGDTLYFEYTTLAAVRPTTGADKTSFTADDDTCLLDDELIVQGLVWRWKRTKGLEYSEEFRDYQTSVMSAIARDGGRSVLDMGEPAYNPGVLYMPQAPGIVPVP